MSETTSKNDNNIVDLESVRLPRLSDAYYKSQWCTIMECLGTYRVIRIYKSSEPLEFDYHKVHINELTPVDFSKFVRFTPPIK